MNANEKLKIRVLRFRAMAKHMSQLVPGLKRRVFDGDFKRADGDVECPGCSLPLFQHPEVDGSPTFHLDCAGKIWKT